MHSVKLIVYLILSLAPVAVLVRDWRFHDRRTITHHRITRAIVVMWLVGSLASVALLLHAEHHSSQLSAKVDDLVQGKNELLSKIGTYEADLVEKQRIINRLGEDTRRLRQGITAVYYPKGTMHRTEGAKVWVDKSLVASYEKMERLQGAYRFAELTTLCESLIEQHPDWPTPHIFLGVAHEHLGDKAAAIREYNVFLDMAPEDPEYQYGGIRRTVRGFLNDLD